MRLPLILALLLPAPALAAGVEVLDDQRVLVLDFRNDNDEGKNAGTVRLVTDVVASALARHEKLTVVTSKDLARVVGLEAEKQVAGCQDEGSCLAELGDALDADLVVAGSLGALGELQVATVTVHKGLKTIERFTVTGKPESLPGLLEEQIDAFLARLYPSGDVVAPAPAPEPAPEPGWSALQWGGVGVAAGGFALAALSAAGWAVSEGVLADTTSTVSRRAKDEARGFGLLSVAGTVVGLGALGGGAAMIVFGGAE